jgi:hypothetical protein
MHHYRQSTFHAITGARYCGRVPHSTRQKTGYAIARIKGRQTFVRWKKFFYAPKAIGAYLVRTTAGAHLSGAVYMPHLTRQRTGPRWVRIN